VNLLSKQALVIGGSGFLGGAIAAQLAEDGWNVEVLGRGNKRVMPGFAFLQADRTVPEQLSAALSGKHYELVVDCAAYKKADAENVIPLLNGRCGHYVFISTDYVYASSSLTTYPITEAALTQRDAPYAVGKLDCEQLLLEAWESSRFPVTVLRAPHILGAGKGLGSDQALGRDAALLDKIAGGEGLELIADGQLLIQPVWTREIARCIAHIAGMQASFGGLFNCTGPEAVTTRRYYEIVAEMLGVELTYTSVPLPVHLQRKPSDAHYARHRVYDMSRLTAITGYKPQLKLTDALQETFEWMRSDYKASK
jgi:nucleoside-diphosphate-sugar epimerase